jgi:hypothetical protein
MLLGFSQRTASRGSLSGKRSDRKFDEGFQLPRVAAGEILMGQAIVQRES